MWWGAISVIAIWELEWDMCFKDTMPLCIVVKEFGIERFGNCEISRLGNREIEKQ